MAPYLGKDGARTPMPWIAGACNGGFSTVEPWLPVPSEHHALAADQHGESSLMYSIKALMHIRRENQVLKWGDILDIEATDNVLSFTRELGEERIRVIMNFSAAEVTLDLGESARLIAGVSSEGLMETAPDALPAFSGVIAQV